MTGTWTTDDLVRAVGRMEETLREMRAEQRTSAERMVPRESWELAMAALREWRGQVSAEVIDIKADAGRHQREVAERFEKERHDRLVAQRWGIGIAVPTLVAVVSMVIQALP